MRAWAWLAAPVAAGVGWAVVGLWVSPPSGASPDPAGDVQEAAPSTPEACAEQLPAARQGNAEVEESIEVLAFQERLLRAQLRPIGGLPVPWGDEVPVEDREGEVRKALSAADETIDVAAIIELDCSEYPCLVWMETTGEASTQEGVSSSEDGSALLEAAGMVGYLTAASVKVGDQVRGYAVGVAASGALGPDISKRVGVRTRRAMVTLRERLQAEGVTP